MTAYFVTSTGTDIGKTFVTAGLIRHLRAQGEPVAALKPLVSGFDPHNVAGSDPAVLLEALGEAPKLDAIARIAPWRFAAPLSPDMAAAREGKHIDVSGLIAFCRKAIAGHRGTLLIEGVGGIMVPLDECHTVLDWAKALGLPLIVIAGSYLGTLSHTLTALDVAARAGLSVAAVVVNESAGATVPLDETVRSLGRFTAAPVATVPRGDAGPAFAALAGLLGAAEAG
jgi:dethiobiotin synthetase